MNTLFHTCYNSFFLFYQKIFLIISIGTLSICAQSFQISIHPSERFSIDRFTNEVYYVHYYTKQIFVSNLNNGSTLPAQFSSLPIFANTSHKCAYKKYDSLFVFDFTSGEKQFIAVNDSMGLYIFSPSDEYLLYPHFYYKFSDSSIHQMPYTPVFDKDDWFDDNTILAASFPDNYIWSFNFITGIYDSLFIRYPKAFTAFSFDRERKLLYYSLEEWDIPPKIYVYNLQTQMDSVIFDPEIQDTNNIFCWQMPNFIKSLEWSPDNKRMGFFNSMNFSSLAGIYAFNLESGKTYPYSNCLHEGRKYYLKWLNNDTVVYFNANSFSIDGLSLDHPLGVDQENLNETPEEYNLTAFPNPFNGEVNILINGNFKEPELNVYNINGELIRNFELIGSTSRYELRWDGRNQTGELVASGIYVLLVIDKKDFLSITRSLKIIHIK